MRKIFFLTLFLSMFTIAAAETETAKVQLKFSALFAGCNVPQMPERVAIPLENCFSGLKEDEDGRYTCILTLRKGSDPERTLQSLRRLEKSFSTHLPPQITYRAAEFRKN